MIATTEGKRGEATTPPRIVIPESSAGTNRTEETTVCESVADLSIQTSLAELESVIEKGIQTFIEVGNALCRIRDGKLYRATHSTFESYCKERWGMTKRNANLLIVEAEVAKEMGTIVPEINRGQARELSRVEPEQRQRVIEAAAEATGGKLTAKAIREASERRPHVSNNSGENEWYTPRPIIEQARQVLGVIELDPASSDKAQEVVQAKQYFTRHNSGLDKQWQGNLWMNPPYAQPLISQFATKLVESVKAESVTEGIVLVNNATETAWFQQMLAEATAVCFIKGRLKFIDTQGNPSGAPLQGQALLYFGSNVRGFRGAFAGTGICLEGGAK
jgi:phage N-6-adenine-methyltransferase